MAGRVGVRALFQPSARATISASARSSATRSRTTPSARAGPWPKASAGSRPILNYDPRRAQHRGGVIVKKQNTGELSLSGVQTRRPVSHRQLFIGFGSSWLLELRMPPAKSRQRKRTRRTQRAHPVQGKVHGSASLVDVRKPSRRRRRSEGTVHRRCKIRCICHARREWLRQAIDRAPQKIRRAFPCGSAKLSRESCKSVGAAAYRGDSTPEQRMLRTIPLAPTCAVATNGFH